MLLPHFFFVIIPKVFFVYVKSGLNEQLSNVLRLLKVKKIIIKKNKWYNILAMATIIIMKFMLSYPLLCLVVQWIVVQLNKII